MSDDRGSGRTTRQMQEAPPGAIFVWCNRHLEYPRALAARLGRDPLQFVRPLAWLTPLNVEGRALTCVVIDHAARPDQIGLDAVAYLRARGVDVKW